MVRSSVGAFDRSRAELAVDGATWADLDMVVDDVRRPPALAVHACHGPLFADLQVAVRARRRNKRPAKVAAEHLLVALALVRRLLYRSHTRMAVLAFHCAHAARVDVMPNLASHEPALAVLARE
jgi:hypothetical protein